MNDASDFKRGADSEDRLGPPRMAASGLLTPRALYFGASLWFAVAFLFGVYLILQAGLWMLAIGLVSIFFAVIYTAGPFPLAYLGLGDLFVMIFFGLVAVLGTYYAQTGRLEVSALFLAIASGFHGMSLIAVNNLRDIPTDIRAGKKTLAVRLGDQGSRFYVAILFFLPFFIWMPVAKNLPPVPALLPIFALPLASANAVAVFRIENRRNFNILLGRCAALLLTFGLLSSLSLVASK